MRILIAFLLAAWPIVAGAEDTPPHIAVTAVGTASATPDMATVSLGVSREARTASQAMEAVASAADAVLAEIASAGIEARDVQTASLNLNPVWDQGNSRPPQVRGYVASTVLSVRVRDLDALGGLLDAVVGEGANTLNGLSFGIAAPEPLEALARADAVRQARAKAETLAEAAGVTLGAIQSISEGGGAISPAPMMRGTMMEAAMVPVAAGELDLSVTVTVVYGIGS